MDDSLLGEKLEMLDYLAEKRNVLLLEKHKCLKTEVAQLKDLFTTMKGYGTALEDSGMTQSLKEAEERLEKKLDPVKTGGAVEENCSEKSSDDRDEIKWLKEKIKEMEENLTAFQQTHTQLLKENELVMGELEAAKDLLAKVTRHDPNAMQQLKEASTQNPKLTSFEGQPFIVDAQTVASAVKHALEQVQPFKAVPEANHSSRINDVRLKNSLEKAVKLGDENNELKSKLKQMQAKYLCAEKQLLVAFGSIKGLKQTVNNLTNRLRTSVHEGDSMLEKANSTITVLRGKVDQLERESSSTGAELQEAMSTIARLKESKTSLQEALKETEPMEKLFVSATNQLRQANRVIEEQTLRIGELERELRSERENTRDKLKGMLDSIERVNSRLKILQEPTSKSAEPPPEIVTGTTTSTTTDDVMSMISLLINRLQVLENNVNEQERMKSQGLLVDSNLLEKSKNCYKTMDEALSRVREEYKHTCSELAAMQSKKVSVNATLKQLEENITDKRKAIEQDRISMEKALSELENGFKQLSEKKPVEGKAGSSAKVSNSPLPSSQDEPQADQKNGEEEERCAKEKERYAVPEKRRLAY